ncbi:hypothetical protein TVAGG3_0450910 [Trichomonas vaginalis G3]|uniref:hypothetical protein n=1 Tax=Trichomonas vaginalis (strain ATCC PRA-98 / G3) TaxID=412133 RepID=UPI0021E54A86|nr:hypothetical protein TVAGG3_0450910 [Trichomonas vaginalis G3]KAI5538147.1 hypothetical protein TVAGG3_0450910 [Trichomonas vaginalis G3]
MEEEDVGENFSLDIASSDLSKCFTDELPSLQLTPVTDNIDTFTKSDNFPNAWFGNLTVQKLYKPTFPGSEANTNALAVVRMICIINILEKYNELKKSVICNFKKKMEIMKYDKQIDRNTAQKEVDDCVNCLNHIAKSAENQIENILHSTKNKADDSLNLNKLDIEKEREVCKIIFGTDIKSKLPHGIVDNLCKKIQKDKIKIQRLIAQRRYFLKEKYAKGDGSRPKWVPKEITDQMLLEFSQGTRNAINIGSSEPNTQDVILTFYQLPLF